MNSFHKVPVGGSSPPAATNNDRGFTLLSGADIVIDNLSGDVLAKSIEATKPKATITPIVFSAGPEVKFDIRNLFFAQKKLLGSMGSNIEDFNWGLEQVRVGRIKPLLNHTFPLSKAERRTT